MSEADASYVSAIWGWAMLCSRVFGVLVMGVTLLIYFNQDRILYIPNPPGVPRTPDDNPPGFSSPGDWSTTGRLRREGDTPLPFEEHYLETADKARLHTWLLLHEDSQSRPTLIYFHGNAANMGFRLPNAVAMFHDSQVNVLMVDYRGYGKSEGTPTEKGLQYDADAVLEFVSTHPRLQGSPVIAFGRSLGGAVAIYLAHKFPASVAGVVVENTFLSISAMTDLLMPIVKPVKPLLLRMFWDNEQRVQDLHQPVLFISGALDELVPAAHMAQLHAAATRSRHKELFVVANGQHNNTWEAAGKAYYNRLRTFIYERVVGQLSAPAPVEDSVMAAGAEPALETAEANAENEDDYFLVGRAAAIPTMGTDFVVR